MIHFERVPEPADFDEKARRPGNAWLENHSGAERPRDYWTPFKPALRSAFRGLCGYSAMYIPSGGGEIDHYVGYKEGPALTYEWGNYRYCLSWLNKAKGHRHPGALQVLDPYEIQDGWFEVHLPSFQLLITDLLPGHLRARAEYTMKRLQLRDHEQMIEERQAWYELYESGALSLDGLHQVAPLLARAVEKQMASE